MIDDLSLMNIEDNIIPLIAICLSSLAISVAIYLYFMTRIFTLKEYKEKKRETVFNWVHENLIEDVYIPLSEHAGGISVELSLRDKDRKEMVLYRISKFLYYIFENRKIFGTDMYFTPNGDSNRHLENISEKIMFEMDAIYDRQDNKNPIERRIVILEFLATCAKCKNYSEFKSLIRGRPIFNNDLTGEITNLKDAYSDEYYLLFRCDDYTNILLNPINELINPQKLWQAWRNAKIYAYCSLFNTLLIYEIYNMYDSWYVKHPDTINHHQLFDVIGCVDDFVEETDKQLMYNYKLGQESYNKTNALHDADMINDVLNGVKQGVSSAIDSGREIEFTEEIRRLEMLRNIELLYSISPQRYEVLEKYRSEEFYKSIIDMRYSFSWDDLPGNDSERLIRYLRNDHGISWAESAEIHKSSDGKTIRIFNDKKSVKIRINKKKEKATLKIRYGITHNLKVEKKGGKLHITDMRLLKTIS